MARVRGFINDNSSGKVFANTSNTTNANFIVVSSAVASGSGVKRNLSIQLQKAGRRMSAANGAANPITMFSSGNITSVLFNFRATSTKSNPAASGETTIRLTHQPYGSSNANTVGTMIIPANTSSSTNVLSMAFNSGDKFWADVVSVASTNSGQGLLMTLNFTRDN